MSRTFNTIASNSSNLLRVLVVATIGLGLTLRLWQFSANSSLWLDELAVVRNIIHLPLKRLLFSPLEYDQMTPVGFLIVGRLLSSLIADQDWVFRVIPLVSSTLTLPLIYLIGRRTIGQLPATVATALVALSPAMIHFSALSKQYASDVFICSALVYGALRIMSDNSKKRGELFLLGLGAGVLLFFSFPATLVACGLAAHISVKWIVERRSGLVGLVAALGMPLATCAGLASAMALQARSPDTASYMTAMWAHGFPPQSLMRWPDWLWGQCSNLYTSAFLGQGGEGFWAPIAAMLLSLGLIGCIALIRKKSATALAVLTPFIMALGAAAAQLYPLSNRLSFFLTPCLAILTAFGACVVGTFLRRFVLHAVPAACAATLAGTILALIASPPPYIREDMRPLMERIAAERHTTDAVYSYYAANQAVDYYSERFGITEWDAGACHRGNPRAYLEELDAYRGSPRVWIIFTHVLPQYTEADVILGYLQTIGTERKALTQHGAVAYLFDLSDPDLLNRITVQDYAFEENIPWQLESACNKGPQSKWQRPRR